MVTGGCDGGHAPAVAVSSCFCACYSDGAAYTPGAAVAKLAYAAGLKSAGDFPVVGSTPTSRTTLREMQKRASVEFPSRSSLIGSPDRVIVLGPLERLSDMLAASHLEYEGLRRGRV